VTTSKKAKDIAQPQKAAKHHRQNRLFSAVLLFITLFVTWLVLSRHYDAKFISTGAILAAVVTLFTNDLFHSLFENGKKERINARSTLLQLWHFLIYIPWLIFKIIQANIQVAYLVLHPRMPIDPFFLQFRTKMRRGISRVTLANSITLTPGTVTVNLEDGEYIIHTLEPSAAGEILEARMQNRIAPIFMDEKEEPPATMWKYSVEELPQ